MTTTTLRVKQPPGFRVDASPLLPAPLAALSVAEIERLELVAGNDVCRVGDLFDVTRDDTAAGSPDGASQPALLIEGDATHWLDRLGARMDGGALTVHGGAGEEAGLAMRGGTLTIEGAAGHFAGRAMYGGHLMIGGDCGNFAAAALPGDMEGMTGGTLTIRGNAGARLADRMRRGLVWVSGNAGEFAAARLVAGTVGIGGQVGPHPAYGMRRGTLLLVHAPEALPPTFVEGGRGFDVFWALLARSLDAAGIAPPSAWPAWRAAPLPKRHAGDLAVDGRGEILIVRQHE